MCGGVKPPSDRKSQKVGPDHFKVVEKVGPTSRSYCHVVLFSIMSVGILSSAEVLYGIL